MIIFLKDNFLVLFSQYWFKINFTYETREQTIGFNRIELHLQFRYSNGLIGFSKTNKIITEYGILDLV